jgi:hypothetical protein
MRTRPRLGRLRVSSASAGTSFGMGSERERECIGVGGTLIGIEAWRVRLSDLELRRLERFVYEYDFGDGCIHDLRIERTLPVNPRTIYPIAWPGGVLNRRRTGGPAAFMASRGDLNKWTFCVRQD